MFKNILQEITQKSVNTEEKFSNNYIEAINYYPRVHSVIFGEAGSGKSTYAMTVLKYLKEHKYINNYFYVDYDSKVLDEVLDILNQSSKEGWGYVSTLIPKISEAYNKSYIKLLHDVIDSLEENSILLVDTLAHLVSKSNDKDEMKSLWKDLKVRLAKTNSYLMVIGHTGKNLDLGMVGSVHIDSEVTYMTRLEKTGRATIWKDSNGTNTYNNFDITISEGDSFINRSASVSDIYKASDIILKLNEKEVRDMYKLNVLRAKYVKLLLPTIKREWDNLDGKEDVKMISVADTIKLAIRLFDVGEEVVENLLSPIFIQANSKIVLGNMFNIESIKINKSKSGRPAEFIQYVTSTTLLDNLSDKVLEIMDKVEITWLPHVVADFKGKLVYVHPTRKVIDGKILEANRPLNKKEIEAIESILKNEFDGETDINSLIDYLYKTVKLISKRKARAGINWLIKQDKLGSKKIGRTTYVKLIGSIKSEEN